MFLQLVVSRLMFARVIYSDLISYVDESLCLSEITKGDQKNMFVVQSGPKVYTPATTSDY